MNQPPGPTHQPPNHVPGRPGGHAPPQPHWIPQPPPGPPAAARSPDPGSRTASLIAKLVAIPLLLLVATFQQISIYMPAPEAEGAPPVVAPDLTDEGLTVSRVFLKLSAAMPSLRTSGEPLRSMDALWKNEQQSPAPASWRRWGEAMDARVNELRAALIAGEVAGPAAAIERLDALDARINLDGDALSRLAADRLGIVAGGSTWTDPDATWTPVDAGSDAAARSEAEKIQDALVDSSAVLRVLRADGALFRTHYQRAAESGGASDALDDDAWEGLIERHGWFAELARTVGRPPQDATRKTMFEGGGALFVLLAVIGGLVLLAAVGSITAIIVLVLRLGVRRAPMWFVPPAPGGSVYLETVALFIVAFLVTQLIAGTLTSVPGLADHMMEVAMGLQWLVLLVIFWPLTRGVSVQRWRRDLGLIAPRGLWREVGAGAVGYLAFLPLLVAAMAVGVLLKALQDTLLADYLPKASGGNPVLEVLSGGGPLRMVLFFAMATIWAPLVEEIVFRGCLYRHLRGRVGFLVAGPLSALAFGLMHGYELVLLGGVIALGMAFSFIREWRGSLVGAIIMHALHNGTLLLLMIGVLKFAA